VLSAQKGCTAGVPWDEDRPDGALSGAPRPPNTFRVRAPVIGRRPNPITPLLVAPVLPPPAGLSRRGHHGGGDCGRGCGRPWVVCHTHECIFLPRVSKADWGVSVSVGTVWFAARQPATTSAANRSKLVSYRVIVATLRTPMRACSSPTMHSCIGARAIPWCN